MLPNRQASLNQFRQGSSYNRGDFIKELNKYLRIYSNRQTTDSFVAKISDTSPTGYMRLVITGHRQFTGQRALTMDIRLGPETATGEPAVFLRSRAPTSSASEYVIGNKVAPSEGGGYGLTGTAQSLADVIMGTFASTLEARTNDLYKRDPLPVDELFSLFTNKTTPRYEKIREKYNIPTGYQLAWGVPTPGEQTQLATYMPVIMGSNKVQEEMSKIYSGIIEESEGIGRIKKLGWFMAEREEGGGIGLKRVARTILSEAEGGREDWFAQVYRGAGPEGEMSTIEALLKHMKSVTTWTASRSPQAFPLEWYRQGKRRVLRPQAAGSYEDLAESPVKGQRQLPASEFGSMLLSGDYSRYVELGIPLPGEESLQRAGLSMGLITALPFAQGGALIDPEELRGVAGYGFYSGEAMDLPWETAQEMSPARRRRLEQPSMTDVLKMVKGLKGRRIQAGAEGYTVGHVTVGGKKVPLTLQGKEYERQIEGATMVIPPLMGKTSGKFYTAIEQEEGLKEKLISTQPLADELTKAFGPMGVTIEASGTTNVPFLYVNTMGRIGRSPKGLLGVKAGEVPTAGLSVTMNKGLMKGKSIKLGMVTQEVKQPLEAFTGAFAVQPYVNKIRMLEMIDPRLAKWYEDTRNSEADYKENDPSSLTLEGLGRKYAELKGMPEHSHYLYLMADMYEKFEGATTKENLANMKRYGIFYLQGGGEVNAGIFHKSAIDAMQDALNRLNKDGQSRTLEDIGIRVTPAKAKGFFNMYFAAPQSRSMAMPILSGNSIEWPGQGKQINKDIVMSLLSQFPTFAKNMGITPGPQDVTGMSKERRAWLGIVGSYAFNEAASKGVVWAPKDDTLYTTINKDRALQLSQELSIFDRNKWEKMTEEEAMGQIKEKFGWSGLYFESLGRFLPSPEAAEGIDKYQVIRNLGESRAHYITQFLNSFRELVQAEIQGGEGNLNLNAHTAFMAGPESRIGRILSGDPKIMKKIYGNEIKGGGSGHFSSAFFLKEGEMVVDKAEAYRIAESKGIKKGKHKAQYWAKIQAGEVEGIFFRYPSLTKKLATLPVKLVAEKEIQRRTGFTMEEFSAVSPGRVWIDPHTMEPFVADLDIDPGGWVIGTDVERDKQGRPLENEEGELTFINTMAQEPGLADFYAENRSFKWFRSALEKVMGEQHADTYSQWMAGISEYMESQLAPETAKAGPLKAIYDFGLSNLKDMARASRLYQNIMTRRGTTHIAANLFKQTTSVLGVPDRMKQEAMKGIGALYQSSLEMSHYAGTFSPLEMLVNTMMFGPEGGDPNSSDVYLSGAVGQEWVEAEGKYQPSYVKFWGAGMGNQKQFMRNVVQYIGGMKEFGPETMALALASRKNLRKNYNMIKTLLKSAPQEEWISLMQGMSGRKSLVDAGIVDETSMIGTMLMTIGALRTHKLSGVTDERGMMLRGMMGTKVPYGGQEYSIEEFLQQPEIQALSSLFQGATGKEYDRPGSGILDISQLEQLEQQVPATARTGTSFVDILLGIGKFFGVGRTEKQIRTPGGLTDSKLIEQLTYGPGWFRASELASVAVGIPEIAEHLGLAPERRTFGNYGPASLLKIASKWLGGVAQENVMTRIDDYTRLSGKAAEIAEKGNMYELAMMIFGTESTDVMPGMRKSRYGGKITSAGLTMIPHAMGVSAPSVEATFDVTQAGQTMPKKLSGTADMIGLYTDPDSGEEFLHIQELKWGGTRKRSASVQAVLYRDLLKQAAKQDEAKLRETLETYRESAMFTYEEARRGIPDLEDKLPGIADQDWVERAIKAIKADRIKLSIGTGMGRDEFLQQPVLPVYRWQEIDPEYNKLGAPQIIEAASKYITSHLVTDLIGQLKDLWTSGAVTIPFGSNLNIGEATSSKIEGVATWIKSQGSNLRNLLGTQTFRSQAGMLYGHGDPFAGGPMFMTPSEMYEGRRIIETGRGELPAVQQLMSGQPQPTAEETERAEGITGEMAFKASETDELRSVGPGFVVTQSTLENIVKQIVTNGLKIFQQALGGGSGDDSGNFTTITQGRFMGGRTPGFSVDVAKDVWSGLASYRTLANAPEIKEVTAAARELQKVMRGAGMGGAVVEQFDLRKARKDPGLLSRQAEAMVLQAAMMGTPEVQEAAAKVVEPLQRLEPRLAPIRKAAGHLMRADNRSQITALLHAQYGEEVGNQMLAELDKMQGVMSEGGMLSASQEGSAPMLAQVLKAAGFPEKGGGGTRTTGTQQTPQFSPQEVLDIYNNTAAAVKDLGEKLKVNVTPQMVKFAAEIETGKVRVEQLNKELGGITKLREGGLEAERGEGWVFTAGPEGMEARRYEKGHFGSTRAAQLLKGKPAEEMLAAFQEREELEGGIAAAQEQLKPEGRGIRWGRLARGTFGGFGWMFLQRALGMGLRGVTEGYEESEQFKAEQQAMAMRYFGAARVSPTAGGQFYARQRAMIAQGRTGLGATAYQLQTQLTGTTAGDWWRSLQTGLGFAMAGSFLSSELAGAGVTAGLAGGTGAFAGIGAGVSLGIGALVAGVAMPAAMQYSYLQNREGTLSRVAAQRMRQADTGLSDWSRWWSGVSADWTQWSNVSADRQRMLEQGALAAGLRERSPATGPNVGIRGAPGAANPALRPYQTGQTPFQMQQERLAQLGTQYSAGGITVTAGMDRQKMASGLIRLFTENAGILPEQFANMPTEIWTNAMMLQMAAAAPGQTVDVEAAARLGRLQMAGIAPEQMYTAAVGAGLAPSVQNMAGIFAGISQEPEVARQQLMGLQTIGGLSPAARQSLGIQSTTDYMMRMAQRYGQIAQTPQWENIAREATALGYWESLGLEEPGGAAARIPEPPQIGRRENRRAYQRRLQQYYENLGQFTPEDLRETVFEEQQKGRYEGALAAGWSTEQAGALRTMYEQAFEAGPQAMAMMPQAEQYMQQAVYYGMAPEAAMGAAGGFGALAAQGQYGQINMITGAMQGQPQAVVMRRLQQMGPAPNYVTANQWAQQAAMVNGMRAPVDITAAGQVTGMGMFQSYISPTQAAGMFGTGWENRPVAAATQAAGVNIGGRNFIGQWAIQATVAQRNYEQQMAGIGNQMAQIALTRQYYLGGGQMGRGLFAIQDSQRALGYEQTEWQFGRQRQQLTMQGQQFRENQALNWQGMQMNRRFTQAGWAFQDQVRALQWGWQQEDFQEQARFMTGRQRRLAERQQQRATIMHGMEEENIDRQRSQQKEMWGLEDQRFDLIQKHYKEQEEFQKTGIKDQEEFYKRRRALEEEMVELQRTYMLEQLKLQESAIGAQAQYAKDMHEHQLDMIAMNQEIAKTVDEWQTAWNYGDLAAEVFKQITDWLEDLAKRFDVDIPKDGKTVFEDPGYGTQPPEDKKENPDVPPIVTMTPWEDTVLALNGEQVAQGGQQITIYIGNEKLGTYVIDTVTKELTIG